MKILIKIFLLLFILIIVYGILIFAAPSLADDIGKTLGLSEVNKNLRLLKGDLDTASTSDLDKLEFVKQAKDLQKKANETVNGVKNTINDVRSGVNSTVETYEEVKGQVEDVVDTLDKTGKQLQDVKNNFDGLKSNFEETLDGKNSKNRKRIEDLKKQYDSLTK